MNTSKPLPHIGVDIWIAFTSYRRAMYADVAASGFADITEADSDVLVWVGPNGTTITAIAKARGVTKQAVQGQVQGLIARGYLHSKTDPSDQRARLLQRTEKGCELARTMDAVKMRLNTAIQTKIGTEGLHHLRQLLSDVTETLTES